MKRLSLLWSALLLLMSAIPRVSAEPVPDPARTGSIAVQIACQGSPVPGGSITLHRVALLRESLEYAPESAFSDSGVDLDSPLTPDAAQLLAEHAKTQQLPGESLRLGDSGRAVFSNLSAGLYLLVQEEPGTGFLPVNPFLVSIPMAIGGSYVYDVDASPKAAPMPTPPQLPQTGQYNRPIPLLTVMGATLLLTGLYLCFSSGRNRHGP